MCKYILAEMSRDRAGPQPVGPAPPDGIKRDRPGPQPVGPGPPAGIRVRAGPQPAGPALLQLIPNGICCRGPGGPLNLGYIFLCFVVKSSLFFGEKYRWPKSPFPPTPWSPDLSRLLPTFWAVYGHLGVWLRKTDPAPDRHFIVYGFPSLIYDLVDLFSKIVDLFRQDG